MKYVSVNYSYTSGFTTPASWFKRTEGYTGFLEQLGVHNDVIAIQQIDYEGACDHNGVQHHFLNFDKKKTLFPKQLNRFVKNLKPDVVIIQGLHQPLQFLQLRWLLGNKTRIIAQHHAEKPFIGIKKYLQQLADRYIHAYLFASYDMGMEWVKKGNLANPSKIHEVMEVSSVFYPVDKESAQQKTGVSGNPVFLWVGRLNENKDPLNVVNAFLQYVTIEPSARLYMFYHTDELLGSIKAILNTAIHQDAIKLMGKVPNEELLYWYNSADFFISGSHYEGSGTAVCEAMSCGCIPVVTDIFSFRMITDNGKCGILYEAGNQAALLTALVKTGQLNIEEKRQQSIQHFREKLSFEAIAKQVAQIANAL